ncbi:unnamed protein product [Echinostoma caproni]|uniref:HYR domain-containing protein n=1 Tax=Echinostoma caproni TaxID=27848 RepID=A0A183AFE0_9TREM|nr:unnamed protein product [Echinostoma caproni]
MTDQESNSEDKHIITALYIIIALGVIGILAGLLSLIIKWVFRQKKGIIQDHSTNAFVREDHFPSPDEEPIPIRRILARSIRETWNTLRARFTNRTKHKGKSSPTLGTTDKSLVFLHCPPSVSALNRPPCNWFWNMMQYDRCQPSPEPETCICSDYGKYAKEPTAWAAPIDPDAVMQRYHALLRSFKKSASQADDNTTGQLNRTFEPDSYVDKTCSALDEINYPETTAKLDTDRCHFRSRSNERADSYEIGQGDGPDYQICKAKLIVGNSSCPLQTACHSGYPALLSKKHEEQASRDTFHLPLKTSAECSSTGACMSAFSHTVLQSDKSERFVVCERAVMCRPRLLETEHTSIYSRGDRISNPNVAHWKNGSSSHSVSSLGEGTETVLSQNTSISLSFPPTSIQWAGDGVPNQIT